MAKILRGPEQITDTAATAQLVAARAEIYNLTGQILDLVNRRTECALVVAEAKAAGGATHIRDTGREEIVLAAMDRANQGPMQPADVHDLGRTLIEITCRAQSELTGLPIDPPAQPSAVPMPVFQPEFPEEL
jgi:chorismate mutase